jgi:twinkle protein
MHYRILEINLKQVSFVSLSSLDSSSSPLAALNRGHTHLMSALKNAKPFVNKQIVTFQQLREEVYSELCNANQVAGVKWQRFPKLTQTLKGHRPGELTVFTGVTGAGKTTLISELSLDLCQQGVATLWGSFEIRNVRLAKMMLKQFSGLNLERHLKQYGYWANQFQQLPLYFMGFYGAADISSVLEVSFFPSLPPSLHSLLLDWLSTFVLALW